jgi:hypothetical protein
MGPQIEMQGREIAGHRWVTRLRTLAHDAVPFPVARLLAVIGLHSVHSPPMVPAAGSRQ